MGLGSKFRDGSSGSFTTGRRPVTRLDLKAVPAWGVGGEGGYRHVVRAVGPAFLGLLV